MGSRFMQVQEAHFAVIRAGLSWLDFSHQMKLFGTEHKLYHNNKSLFAQLIIRLGPVKT